MVWNGTVEEDRVGIVDDLLKDEVFQLKTRGEGRIQSGVARSELRPFGDCVVISAPNEFDGITDGSVDGEGNITKDALGGSNVDNVSLASFGGRAIARRHRRGIFGLTLLNTVVIGVHVTSPAVASRSVGRGRIGLVRGRRSTVWRKRTVGGGVGRGMGIVVVAICIIVIAAVAHAATTIGGERGRRTPGARWRYFICGPRVVARSVIHAIAVPATFDQNGEGSAVRDRVLTSCQCWKYRWFLGDPQGAVLQRPRTDKEQEGSRRWVNGPSSRFERMESERLWLAINVCRTSERIVFSSQRVPRNRLCRRE